MSTLTNLNLIKALVTTNIPPLLVTAGLVDLDEYVVGGPTDSELKSLGCYLGTGGDDDTVVNFKPVLQLQLNGVNYATGLLYFAIIDDYLRSIDPCDVGMTVRNRQEYTEFPPDETGTTFFTWYIDYSLDLDDCD